MKLSKQETNVARLITEGYSEKEIASKLFISPHTVHNHTYNIRKKWNARSAVDVCRKFIIKNPKEFILSMMFLVMQLNMTFSMPDADFLRTSTRTNSVRTIRTPRKK